jgi:hypothetical protein
MMAAPVLVWVGIGRFGYVLVVYATLQPGMIIRHIPLLSGDIPLIHYLIES